MDRDCFVGVTIHSHQTKIEESAYHYVSGLHVCRKPRCFVLQVVCIFDMCIISAFILALSAAICMFRFHVFFHVVVTLMINERNYGLGYEFCFLCFLSVRKTHHLGLHIHRFLHTSKVCSVHWQDLP